jgi:hypothetical protein
VVIADLGLAKALAAASGVTARAGTPGYMAPEQDNPLGVVDTRADVYALGRLGLVLLPAGVPPRVADVLRKATARAPDDRYRDANAFGAALDRATAGRHRSTWRRVLVAGVALAATVIAIAADSGRTGAVAGTSTDATGRITVTLPAGWRATGSGWAGRRGPDGDLEPALLLSPDPRRWSSDSAVPGAFVGLTRTDATPARFLAEHPHPECAGAPVRTNRIAGIDWVIAEFTSCRGGKPVIVEAAGIGPDGAGLTYIQIAPPAGSGSSFVDTLLAGVRVRP